MANKKLIVIIKMTNGDIFKTHHDDISDKVEETNDAEMKKLFSKIKNYYMSSEKDDIFIFPSIDGTISLLNKNNISSVNIELVSNEEFEKREQEQEKTREEEQMKLNNALNVSNYRLHY